jgi:hypothetical protein
MQENLKDLPLIIFCEIDVRDLRSKTKMLFQKLVDNFVIFMMKKTQRK